MTATTETTIFVERSAHWGGDVSRFAESLLVRVLEQANAADLAPVAEIYASRDPEKMARLADAARRILAEDEAALDPVLA